MRRRFAHLNMSTHFLDLRGLQFKLRRENFHKIGGWWKSGVKLAVVFGGEGDAQLMWLDPSDSQWKLGVAGNTGGTAHL